MKYTLIIKGDWNDADYIHSVHVCDEEVVGIFRKLADVMKSTGGKWKRWCDSGPEPEEMYPSMTEDEMEILTDYLPQHSEFGIHTINCIAIAPQIKWELLHGYDRGLR